MYIGDLAKFKEYESVNEDINYNSIRPYENLSIEKYFLPVFSYGLLNQIFAFSVNPAGSTERRSYDLFLGALVRFSLVEWVATGEITIGAGGITRKEGAHSKSAYAQQVSRLVDSKENNAYFGMNGLIDLFNENPTIFTEWPTSPGYTFNQGLMIQSSTEFNASKRLYRPYITFQALIPNIETQQEFYLYSGFDKALIDELIENLSGMSAEKKQVRKYLVKALAHLTLMLSIKDGLVRFTKEGARIFEQDEETSKTLEVKPDLVGAASTLKSLEDTGKRYISRAKAYMLDYPGEFPPPEEPECPEAPKHPRIYVA